LATVAELWVLAIDQLSQFTGIRAAETFFEPFHLHLQPADLLEQLCFIGLALVCPVSIKLMGGSPDADPSLSQGGEAFTVINVSTQQLFTAEGCQPSVWVGMHGVRGQ